MSAPYSTSRYTGTISAFNGYAAGGSWQYVVSVPASTTYVISGYRYSKAYNTTISYTY